MTHTTLLNPYSKEELLYLDIISRIRPLSTLKSLIDSVNVNTYRIAFAIALMNSKGEFTENDVHLISMDSETAYYVPLDARGVPTELTGVNIFKITEDQAKELKAAELVSGCLKTALTHLVGKLEESE